MPILLLEEAPRKPPRRKSGGAPKPTPFENLVEFFRDLPTDIVVGLSLADDGYGCTLRGLQSRIGRVATRLGCKIDSVTDGEVIKAWKVEMSAEESDRNMARVLRARQARKKRGVDNA